MADIFELSLKLTAAGLDELQAGLERVNALGGQAAAALTQAEQASAAFAAANTALGTSALAASASTQALVAGATALDTALRRVGQSASAADAALAGLRAPIGSVESPSVPVPAPAAPLGPAPAAAGAVVLPAVDPAPLLGSVAAAATQALAELQPLTQPIILPAADTAPFVASIASAAETALAALRPPSVVLPPADAAPLVASVARANEQVTAALRSPPPVVLRADAAPLITSVGPARAALESLGPAMAAANAPSTALGQALAQVGAGAQAAAAGAQEVQSGFGVAAPTVAAMVQSITAATTGFGSVSAAARDAATAQAEVGAATTTSAEALDAWDAVLIRSAADTRALGTIQAQATAALEAGAITEQDLADITAELTARHAQLYGTQQAGLLTEEELVAAEKAVAAATEGARGQWASTETAMRTFSGAARQVKADLAAGLITEQDAAAKLAQIRAEAIALRQELGTLSATGAGTFNQILRATSTETGVATTALEGMNTRGLFQVARGMAFMEAASVGAGRGVSQLALGAFLFTGGTWAMVAALAALGIGIGVYELLTGAQQKLDTEFDTAFKKFADQKAGADALGEAYDGLAEAIDRTRTANERLAFFRPPGLEDLVGKDVAAFIGGEQQFPILGPGLGGIVGIIGARHEEQQATEDSAAANRALNAIQTEQIAQYEKEAAVLREQIALGQNVADNRARLRQTEGELTAAVQGHVQAVQQQNLVVFGQIASIPELIAARERERDTILAQIQSTGELDSATKKHLDSVNEALAVLQKAYGLAGAAAKLMADDAKAAAALIAETGKVFGQTAADVSLLFELGLIPAGKLVVLEQSYAAAAKNTNLPLEQRRQAHQAAQQIEQLLLSTERDRLSVVATLGKADGESAATVKALTTEYAALQRQIETGNAKAAAQAVGQQDAVRKAIAAPFEGVIQRANDAAEAVKVFGATAANLADLRVAVAALTGLTDDDNRALLASVGLQNLETQALKARTAAIQELAAATEVMTEAGAAREAPSFGLGGVTKGPTGAPITFGQGISLAPAEQAALVPERPLTPAVPFGAGLQAPLIPGNFFDQSLQNLQQGFDRVNTATRTGIRVLNASMTAAATNLAETFASALRSAFTSVVASIGQLIGNLFAGVSTAGFGKEILAALGGLFVRMGEAMIAASPIFKALAAAMSNPFTAGPALLAYGVALVALGSALGAIAHGGSGAGAPGGGGAGASNEPIRVVVLGNAVGPAAAVQQPVFFNYAPTNIGVTDPLGQAQLSRMLQLAGRRNLPSGI